jgi:tRNA(Ile2) C34 agmatinyltransferase TiaS
MSTNRPACPVCGSQLESEGDFEICAVCNWEDDPYQRKNPEAEGGANKESLTQARKVWSQKKGKAR